MASARSLAAEIGENRTFVPVKQASKAVVYTRYIAACGSAYLTTYVTDALLLKSMRYRGSRRECLFNDIRRAARD